MWAFPICQTSLGISVENARAAQARTFALFYYLFPLSVVRANHSDITHQHVHNLNFDTTSLTLVHISFIVLRT